jgi:glyoxylase-like metal-dependent hydrolase (beta-lactamase superfamily II)
MQLTHFDARRAKRRSCSTPAILDGFEGITGPSAILITHQHPDHATPSGCPHSSSHPQYALQADAQTAETLGGPWRAVNVGDEPGSPPHRARRRRPHAVIHPKSR